MTLTRSERRDAHGLVRAMLWLADRPRTAYGLITVLVGIYALVLWLP